MILVGVVSGLRSQLGTAAVALSTDAAEKARPASLFAGQRAKQVAVVAAAGELVADKLPWAPSRLSRVGLASRVAFGAFAAVALASRRPEDVPPAVAAAVGAVASVAGSYVGACWRRLVADTGRPDWQAALVEDGAAAALAFLAVAPRRTHLRVYLSSRA